GEAYAGDAIQDKEKNYKQWSVNMLTVDHDYIKTLGLEVIAGRDFSTAFPSDEKHAFIISEAAAKMIGYNDPKEALGHELAWPRWDASDTLKEGKVIGVIKDIQLNSMRDNITPVVLQVFPFGYSSLTLKIKPDDVPATIAHLEKSWKTFNADWPFEYKFLDENFDKMYKSEEKLAVLFTFFTAFTILVACMGLLGLVVYSTTQRYKEISIRKVLGAKEAGIVVQLAKQYFLLLGIAFAIAIPVSYYVAVQWLQKFAFHIQVTPMLFLQAAFLILTLTMITVGIQSLKAARANPVDALNEN
ncbi:MAG TPA: FtsX-like permease family protein, partial [Chryseolinea sp.]|nr:FtsX-like permease family protein [Chryseolinea sp.]